MRRVVVIASASGNGKTTLGRELAASLDVPFVELDALVHGPGWVETPDTELRALVEPVLAEDGWVIDGSYRRKLGTLVLDAADTVVWLDLPIRVWLPASFGAPGGASGARGALEREPRVAPRCVCRPRIAGRLRAPVACPPPTRVGGRARSPPAGEAEDDGRRSALPGRGASAAVGFPPDHAAWRKHDGEKARTRRTLRYVARAGAACGGSKKTVATTSTGGGTTTTATTTAAMTHETTTTTAASSSGTPSFASTKNCQELATLAAKVTSSITGQGSTDVNKMADVIEGLANAAPSAIRADFKTLADAYSTFVKAYTSAGLKPEPRRHRPRSRRSRSRPGRCPHRSCRERRRICRRRCTGTARASRLPRGRFSRRAVLLFARQQRPRRLVDAAPSAVDIEWLMPSRVNPARSTRFGCGVANLDVGNNATHAEIERVLCQRGAVLSRRRDRGHVGRAITDLDDRSRESRGRNVVPPRISPVWTSALRRREPSARDERLQVRNEFSEVVACERRPELSEEARET